MRRSIPTPLYLEKKLDAAKTKVAEQEDVLVQRYEAGKEANRNNMDQFNDRSGEIQRRIDDVVGRMKDGGMSVPS